jgi:peroxiredoxin
MMTNSLNHSPADQYPLATELQVSQWLNCPNPLSLAELRGKVVVIHAFQMLCPGCVSHGIPQASAIHQYYSHDEVQVIGLHSVFEHHQVMTSEALIAFIEEYNLTFPIAIDRPSETGPIPKTMADYQMQGTPTLIIIDKLGRLRVNAFGRPSDLQVGDLIGRLISEDYGDLSSENDVPRELVKDEAVKNEARRKENCDQDGCSI